jgi:hypothetical protein
LDSVFRPRLIYTSVLCYPCMQVIATLSLLRFLHRRDVEGWIKGKAQEKAPMCHSLEHLRDYDIADAKSAPSHDQSSPRPTFSFFKLLEDCDIGIDKLANMQIFVKT